MEDLVPQSFLLKVYLAIFNIMVLVYSGKTVTGLITLSPMTVAPVCHVGDQLQITCTAMVDQESGIRWNAFRVNEQTTLEQIISDVFIHPRPSSNQRTSVMPTTVDSVMFTFMRTSEQGATSPLISTLSIDSVSIGLNGTVVRCSDLTDSMISASTTIQIIDTSQNFQYTPTLRISAEHYETDTVTVTVEWTQYESVTYTVTISPLTSTIATGSTSRQVTILYNTEYNFSVEAVPVCRPNPTAFILLHYVNCGRPSLMPVTCTMTCNSDSVPTVVGYDDLVPLEGSTVTFSCPPGWELVGPNSATCTKNGEWGPDPSGIMCNQSQSDPTGLMCTCKNSKVSAYTGTENVPESRTTAECSLAAAVSASVLITFVVTSIIIFIIGFMSGRYFQSFKGKLHITTTDRPQQGPLYDYVQPSTTQRQANLELKVNVAYQPSKAITVKQ